MICPKCKNLYWEDAKDVEMEKKVDILGRATLYHIYQCPDCKNIEVIYNS